MSLIDEKVEALKGIQQATEVKELDRLQYRLSDAIREGCAVSGQAYHWANHQGDLCALSAAVVAAKSRGYQ